MYKVVQKHVQNNTHELIHSMIRKEQYSKQMEIKGSNFTAFFDSFTKNTSVLLIISDTGISKVNSFFGILKCINLILYSFCCNSSQHCCCKKIFRKTWKWSLKHELTLPVLLPVKPYHHILPFLQSTSLWEDQKNQKTTFIKIKKKN